MARVGVITFLHNENYGSSLQAYALQRTIRDMGFDCEHLDYQPDRKEKIKNLLLSGNSPKLILEGIRKKSVKAGQQGAKEKSIAIPAFYARRMKMSSACRNARELREQSMGYDALVCGSDQIWNPVWLNPVYYLNFAPEKTKKIAYAPSLGIRTMPPAGKIRKIRRWMRGFSAVSVREEEGAKLMEQMTGMRPDVMPDPVCLLSRKEWEEIAAPGPEGSPYVLCYFIGTNETYREKVRQISREEGLRILEIPVTAEGYRSGFELLEGIGPEAFLGAIRNAACFCTDSFHGLVFGTILNVRTEVMRRYREEDPESKNSRVDHFQRIIREKGVDALRGEGRAWLRKKLGSEAGGG
ncbi:MAG: polysaccharide pyruvyl transferase family protein [Clostridia bacterium]|nr:polysaccharide pyruvyl transferase family protein [Clostridia bacterium]